MSNLTVELVKNNDHLVGMVKEFNIQQSNVGKPFWMPQTSLKTGAKLFIRATKAGGIKLEIMIKDKPYHVHAGLLYETLQSVDDEWIGKEVDAVIAPQIPNPDITSEDIKRVDALSADTSNERTFDTSKIKAARELMADGKKVSEFIILEIDETIFGE